MNFTKVFQSLTLALIVSTAFNPLNAAITNLEANKQILRALLTYAKLHPEILTNNTPHLVDFNHKHSVDQSANSSLRTVYPLAYKIVESIDSLELNEVLVNLNETEKMIVFESLIAMLVAAKDQSSPFDNYSLITYWQILDKFAETGVVVEKINLVVKELEQIVKSPNQVIFYGRIEKLKSNKKIDQGLKELLMNFIEKNSKVQTADLTKKIVLWRFAQNKK
jgi:hypothetical protein